MLDIPSYLLGRKKGGGKQEGNRIVVPTIVRDMSGSGKLIENITEIYIDTIQGDTLAHLCDGFHNLKKAVINNVKEMNMGFNSMFSGCSSLETVSFSYVGYTKDFTSMFQSCTSLKNAPVLDIKATLACYFTSIFQGCASLENVPIYNLAGANPSNSLNSMFLYCGNLTEESLNNILASLQTATKYRGTKTLKRIGLSQTQAETCTTLPNWQALTDAGWTTGY